MFLRVLKTIVIMVVKNSKGLAMLEALPIIWVMFILMGVTLGSWGIVHTSVLNSIAARNYNFFIFNNRSDLSYLRDFGEKYDLEEAAESRYFGTFGKRFSFIMSELSGTNNSATATLRRVDFRKQEKDSNSPDFLKGSQHTQVHKIIPISRNRKKVGPAWIMVGYGICLDAVCGD